MISEPMALNHLRNGGDSMTHAHFSGPQHLAKHHEAWKAFAIISIPLPPKPNTLSRLSNPNSWPPLYLKLPPNLPSKKQCILFKIRTPYVLVSPFVHRPSLSQIILGTDIHPIPMSFLSWFIYTAKSDHKSGLSSQAHHPSAHISLPRYIGRYLRASSQELVSRTYVDQHSCRILLVSNRKDVLHRSFCLDGLCSRQPHPAHM